MSTRWTWTLVGVAAVAAAVATLLLWPRTTSSEAEASAPTSERSPLLAPERPSTPPVPGRDRPRRAPMPQLPPQSSEIQIRTYAEAVANGSDKPGEAAFRAAIDAFMEYNQAFAEAQAKSEGLTVDEVEELTYFGFLAMQTQQWPEVEELIGRPLTDEERSLGEELLHTTNKEFKVGMRDLVADGASEEARWELIRATQERYRREYFAITGMTPDLLDQLLAGDLSRAYAPAVTPPPEHIEPAEPPPPVERRPATTP